jgi:hypothetical protein
LCGPASQTRVGWGSNAPPLDHIRLSTARPFAIGPHVRTNGVYVLGQLAAPPTYPGDPEAALEDVERASFVPGSRQVNALARATLVWRPATAAGIPVSCDRQR